MWILSSALQLMSAGAKYGNLWMMKFVANVGDMGKDGCWLLLLCSLLSMLWRCLASHLLLYFRSVFEKFCCNFPLDFRNNYPRFRILKNIDGCWQFYDHRILWNGCQIIEALDPQRQCFEYWAAKTQIEPQTSEVQTHTPAAAAGAEPAQNPGNKNYDLLRDTQAYRTGGNNNIAMGNVAMKLAKPNQARANVHSERSAVNPPSSSLLGDKIVDLRSTSVVGGLQSRSSSGTVVDSYPVLRTLFHKASTEELSVLHQLFASDRKSCDWNSGVSALSDELKSRIP